MCEVVGVLESEVVTQAHAIGIRSSSATVIVRFAGPVGHGWSDGRDVEQLEGLGDMGADVHLPVLQAAQSNAPRDM